MSFRNRCQIAGSAGVINLSIPLVQGRDQKTIMKDVRIAGTLPWQEQHWKTLVSCYSRSPWFEFYRDDLAGLYQKPVDFLLDWNLACWEWSIRALQIPIGYSLTETYERDFANDDRVDWRSRILPKKRGKMDLYPAYPVKYRQVFEERTGFLADLSILDLLFCEGKGARSLLV